VPLATSACQEPFPDILNKLDQHRDRALSATTALKEPQFPSLVQRAHFRIKREPLRTTIAWIAHQAIFVQERATQSHIPTAMQALTVRTVSTLQAAVPARSECTALSVHSSSCIAQWDSTRRTRTEVGALTAPSAAIA